MGKTENKLETLGDDRWKCKHCGQEFSGTPSTNPNHLSGQENEVGSSCESAPSRIQQELALTKASKKRPRSSRTREDDGDGVDVDMAPFQYTPSSGEPSNVLAQATPFTTNGASSTDEAEEQELADLVVKFLMSTNMSVDIIHDSYLRTFLTRVAQRGLPTSLFQGNPRILRNSLSNFEHEVNSYMMMVKESWTTTGCTMMFYDFDQGDENVLVVGFYCPRGFIFVEVDKFSNRNNFTESLRDHVLNISMNNVVRFTPHAISHLSKCPYQACRVTDDIGSLNWIEFPDIVTDFCVRQGIEQFYSTICQKSNWVKSLINKSDKIYHYIVGSRLYSKYRKSLDRGRANRLVNGKHAECFSRLRSIMLLEQELRSWLSRLADYERFDLDNEGDVSAIIDNGEFWNDGNDLLHALSPLSKIPRVMDTLVPTSGCLHMAIDEVRRVLETYKDQKCMKFGTIWSCFKRWVTHELFIDPMFSATSYLSPSCIREVQRWGLQPADPVKLILRNVTGAGFEDEALCTEMEGYNIRCKNPFAGISVSECRASHPVKLWYNHGSKFPLLQKCAIKLLSQPAFCLCDPIKKHMSQLQGADNYLLRLNYKMMEEFKSFRDDIYQPIEF